MPRDSSVSLPTEIPGVRWTSGLARLAFAALVGAAFPAAGQSQPVAGQNTNMVSGTTWPGGDPYLQRQNEPSLAVSSRNPLHLLAGANDYRTVDLPTEPGSIPGTLSGDAWLGVFKSFDGGLSWQSTLLPGYPQDTSAVGMASPLKAYGAAADPTLRASASGLLYYSGISFNRGTNNGAVFLSRFFDQNIKENGDATLGRDTIAYVDTKLIDTGTSGQFLDKPWLAVDVPRTGSGATTCSFTPPGGTAQSFVGGNVYMTWSRFTGSTSTKIMFSRSLDCGKTWANAIKISESNSINQGTNIAVDPTNGTVYVAWRRFATTSQPDAIVIAKSTDFGRTFPSNKTKDVATIVPFDQESLGTPGSPAGMQFRTNALPSIAVSVDSSNTSRVHIAWAQRSGPNQDAQIVVATSSDGTTWTVPAVPVDASPITDDSTPAHSFSQGHQFMPQLTFSQGRLMVLYYDQRLDHTLGFYVYQPGDPILNDGQFQGTYTYKLFRDPVGELPDHSDQVFKVKINDAALTERRHTVDLRVASAVPAPGLPLSFSSAMVSQYRFGLRDIDVTETPTELEQLEDNPPNLPLFSQGTVPFLGDYIDIAGQNIVPNGSGGWKFNFAATSAPVFYATWTDNRDVKPPVDGDWTHYTPAGLVHQSVLDPTKQTPLCVNGQEGMRNQNIYSSRITQGLLVGSPQNVKPLSSTLQRAFVVTVQNLTNQQRTFHMTIAAQPAGGWASFTGGANVPTLTAPSPLVDTLDVTVEANSGAARPVFVTSTNPAASITVSVVEAAGGSGLSGSIVLNPEGSVSPLVQPDGSTFNIGGLEIYTPTFEVWDANNTNPFLNIGNPDLSILNIGNLNIGNLNIGNADPILNIGNDSVGNLNIGNLNIGNTDPASLNIGNLNIGNATAANLNIGNLNIGNLNIGNLNIGNTPVSDASYAMKNSGNTTASYRVALYGNNPPNNAALQIIVTKSSTTPTSVGCTLQNLPQGVVVATVNNAQMATSVADATNPKITDSSVSNATVSLAPGERIFVTVRAALTADQMKDFVKQMTPVVTAHGANTNGVANDFAALLFIQTTSGTLPAAVVGVPYNNGAGYQFVAAGGSGTIHWTSTGTLPTGLTLSPSGLLSGTPSGAGPFTFDVTASDGSAPPQTQTATQTISMTVAARTTSTTLTLATNPIVVNAVVAATVTVTDTQPDGNKSFPSGTVTVGSGAVTGSCSLGSTATPGVSTCQASLSAAAAGSYPLTAAFTATTVHAASSSSSVTLTVNPRATATTVTLTPNPVTILSSTAVKATVADVDAAGLKSSPVGVITISSSVAGDVFSPPTCPLSASDSTSSACAVTFTPGSNVARTITATYGGSTVHASSASGGSLTVKGNSATTITSILPSPVAVGVPTTVSVAVAAAPPAAGTPTGTVTVSAGAAGSCTVTLASGTGSCVWTPLSGGSLTLTATYGGDSLFNPSTATSGISVGVFYAFTGFLSPMATAGTHLAPSFSGSSTYGSGQPVKWQLKDASGNYISNLATTVVLQGIPYAAGSCSGPASGSPVLLYSPTTGAKGGSTFRYDNPSHQFIFNWNTGYMPGPGCYELELQLNDGSPIKATIEKLN